MEAVIKIPDTKAGQSVKAHFENEQTLSALSRIMDRLDRLENTIEKLGEAIQQAPEMVGMAADVADQTAKRLSDKGINLEERTDHLLTLVEKLTQPQVLDQLTSLVDAASQAPDFAGSAVDQLDAVVQKAAEKGIDIEARAGQVLTLVEKLTEPQTMEQLTNLVDAVTQAPDFAGSAVDQLDGIMLKAAAQGIDIEQRLGDGLNLLIRLSEPASMQRLNGLLDLADQLPEIIGHAVDEVDGLVAGAAQQGIDLESRIQDGLKLLAKLSSPQMMAKANDAVDFLEHGMDTIGLAVDQIDTIMDEFSRQCVDLTRLNDNVKSMSFAAIKSLNLTMEEHPERKPSSIFGLIGQLNDKDFRKVLAFLATFGKHMGQELGK